MSLQHKANCRGHILGEFLAWLICLALAIFMLRSMLIEARSTLAHDNYYWGFPLFRFFALNIANGHFPLWNPYSHGGEPLFPALLHLRLLEPIPRLIAWLVPEVLTTNTVLLFNWSKACEAWFMAFGIYLWLRIYCRSFWIRLTLVPILLFSSLFLGGMQQDGILNQTLWLPFLILSLDRLLFHPLDKHGIWLYWLLAALAIGVSWQSYFFAGIWLFLFVYLASTGIFSPHVLRKLKERIYSDCRPTLAFLLIVLGMLGPNIFAYQASKSYVHVIRMDDGNVERRGRWADRYEEEGNTSLIKNSLVRLPYSELIRNGNFLNPWNFLQLPTGSANPHILKKSDLTWGKPSEAYLYIGLIPWILAIVGIFLGVAPEKKIWLSLLGFYTLICLGPAAGLHPFVYELLPILWPVRQVHCLAGVIGIALLYFYVLGANKIDRELEKFTCPGS